MKAKAKYLDKEVEFEGKVIDDKTIIPHTVLEELADDNSVDYSYLSLFNNGWSAVFECTASFKTSSGLCRTVHAIGESNTKNLTTDIAKKYPTIMAAKRAFDRAVIRLFGFKDTYADSESIEERKLKKKKAEIPEESVDYPELPVVDIDTVEEEPETVIEDAAEVTPASDEQDDRPVPETEEMPEIPSNAIAFDNTDGVDDYDCDLDDDGGDDASNPFAKKPTVVKKETPIKLPEPENKDDSSDNEDHLTFLDTIVAVGPYNKKGITVNQLYDQDIDALNWIANSRIKGKLFEAQREAALKTIEYRKGA